MRSLSPALAAHLAGGATTLCHCWKLLPRGRAPQGFTDHDRDLAFDGVTYAARAGLDAAEAESALGLAPGSGEVSGALSAASLSEADLAAGVYDLATVETWRVNWADPSQRLLLDVAILGEARRTRAGFAAELRGLAALLDQESGRVYRAACSADLGDVRCGVDLSSTAFSATGVIALTDGRLSFSAAMSGYASGFFAGGRVTMQSGASAGRAMSVKSHVASASSADFALWSPIAALAIGDAFRVTAGCDKLFATCRDRFANSVNFRGFPHMPGNDFVASYPTQGDLSLDGGVAR